MKMAIKTKDLKLAHVRYYDEKHKGLEYSEPLSSVILVKTEDNSYDNLLNPGENFPVFERIARTFNHYSTDGYYGTKIRLVSGELASGEAWLLTSIDFENLFGREYVDFWDIERYVLNSPLYFKDRMRIIEDKLSVEKLSRKERRRLTSIVKEDLKKKEVMDSFFAERENVKVNKK